MKQFVVMQERAEGNSEVGTAWTEAGVFPDTATLAEVWKWAADRGGMTGRTTIRPDGYSMSEDTRDE